VSAATSQAAGAPAAGIRRLWDRQLPHYPDTAARMRYLAITVLATIVLYHQLYVQGGVSTQIIREFGFTFTQFVLIVAGGNLLGAFAALFAGVSDRWGRTNLVVGGLLLVAVLTTFVLPNADSKVGYSVFFALLTIVEGVVLVATPALIRDFSPQVGRASAMAFWTMGPVLGSLLVTVIATNTLDSHPDWRFQFYVAGVAGFVVAIIALLGLRELSPRLRDQLMHSMQDRALIEARAAGIDPELALKGHWRQMFKLDIIGSAFAISVFLIFYYVLVGFLVVYFATVFGYTEARANSLGNWYWATTAISLVVVGLLSDRLRVRKPFMLGGALVGLVGLGLFAAAATNPDTSYGAFRAYLVMSAAGLGLAFVSWMAAFTETVERRNPAATATGLAVYGWTVRIMVTISLTALPFVVPATTILADKGEHVGAIVAKHPQQVKVLQTVDGATLAALKRNPDDRAAQAKALSALSGLTTAEVGRVVALGAKYKEELATAGAIDAATLQTLSQKPTDKAAGAKAAGEIVKKFSIPSAQAVARLQALGRVPSAHLGFLQANGSKVQQAGARLQSVSKVPPADLAYLAANGADVAKASADNPKQWQTYWWICFAAQALFIPFIFVMYGRWSPRKAREDEAEHEREVRAELARLEPAPAPLDAERRTEPVLT
jgi:MFS transporter, ACS family, D-galactonate transporter